MFFKAALWSFSCKQTKVMICFSVTHSIIVCITICQISDKPEKQMQN